MLSGSWVSLLEARWSDVMDLQQAVHSKHIMYDTNYQSLFCSTGMGLQQTVPRD